jgi:hypothetical protein
MAEFDHQRFLRDKWGDPDRLVAFLHAYNEKGYPRPTVNQWFRRRSIPSDAFALLLALLKVDGQAVNVEDYLT